MRTGTKGQIPLVESPRGFAAPAVRDPPQPSGHGRRARPRGLCGRCAGTLQRHLARQPHRRRQILAQHVPDAGSGDAGAVPRASRVRTPDGHKERSGDGRTPEGVYWIDRRNPRSEYFLSLGVSYPNAADVARARAMGVDPGGDIFIHGEPIRGAWHRGKNDWTAGCIAVSNAEIEEIWAMVPTGTQVTILA
jgi:hypothetical protein